MEPTVENGAAGQGRVLAVVAVLGVNAWASVAALPAVHLVRAGDLSLPAALATVLALAPLAAGLWMLFRRHRRSHLALVLAFPLALLLPALTQPSMVRASVLSGPAVGFASVGLAVYLVAACWARSRTDLVLIEASSGPTKPGRGHPRAKILQVALAVGAALATTVIIAAAHLGGSENEGEGGDGSWAVVTSAFGLVLWTIVVLGVLAPAAGRPHLGPMPRGSRGAALVWGLVLAIAMGMLLLSGD